MNKVTTLNQFIIEQQAGVPQATGGFSCLLHHVGIAAKKEKLPISLQPVLSFYWQPKPLLP